MKVRVSHKLALFAAVVAAGCVIVSISGAANEEKRLTLSDVSDRLLRFEKKVADIDQRLAAVEKQLGKRSSELPKKKPIIEITTPKNGAEVGMTVLVECIVRVDDLAGRRPYVAVHPMEASLLWIQPVPIKLDKIEEGYRFRVRIFCGTKKQGIGEKFEICALLAKKGKLKAGDELIRLPKDAPSSSSVLVTRVRN